MKSPHEHGISACAYEGVNRVNISYFGRLQLLFVLRSTRSPILTVFCRPVPPFMFVV
jgi:hypothetical protein